MSRQPGVLQTAHRAVVTEPGWALLFVLEENAERRTLNVQLRKRSPAAAGKLSRRPTSTLNVHSNRPADDHKTESGKFRLLALRN